MKIRVARLITVAALAACSRQPAVTTVTMMSFAFDPFRLTARTGETIRLELRNTDTIPHAFDIPELGVGLAVQPGASVPLEFTVEQAGIYTFSCGIPGHHEAGMEGALIVEAVP